MRTTRSHHSARSGPQRRGTTSVRIFDRATDGHSREGKGQPGRQSMTANPFAFSARAVRWHGSRAAVLPQERRSVSQTAQAKEVAEPAAASRAADAANPRRPKRLPGFARRSVIVLGHPCGDRPPRLPQCFSGLAQCCSPRPFSRTAPCCSYAGMERPASARRGSGIAAPSLRRR
jgi:hypothetical protein